MLQDGGREKDSENMKNGAELKIALGKEADSRSQYYKAINPNISVIITTAQIYSTTDNI